MICTACDGTGQIICTIRETGEPIVFESCPQCDGEGVLCDTQQLSASEGEIRWFLARVRLALVAARKDGNKHNMLNLFDGHQMYVSLYDTGLITETTSKK